MFYIFLIAILNLGLGFAAAMHLGRRYNSLALASPSLNSAPGEGPLGDDRDDDTIESSMDLGIDEDDDTLDEEAAADDSLGEKSADGDNEEGNGNNPTKQPQNTEPNEFDADLDKLFENIDV
ncbi:MAG: hypothetical protein U9N87_02445 [Planctomycetota bacterium]|nr:hypothetical protein [Planctomycetota bacterium]